jgi:hypothetical protein
MAKRLLGLVLIGAMAAIAIGSTQTKVVATLTKLDGTVQVNGNGAGKGATILSDSVVTTAARSSAVVSLGKLGRVEVMPDTGSMKLSFTDNSIALGMLSQGRVRVSSSSGVNASTTTNDGTISANASDKSEYVVDTSCGNTLVAVKKGAVTLRAGNTVKQIAAGNQDTAGTARPGCTPKG